MSRTATSYDHRANGEHEQEISVQYHWVEDQSSDIRSALNTCFVIGCSLSIICLFSVAFDPRGILSNRAILAPKFGNDGRMEAMVLLSEEAAVLPSEK